MQKVAGFECLHHFVERSVDGYSGLECIMAKYEVGFEGRWQETFDDRDQAIQWAQEVAETGRVVDVVVKHLFLPRRLVTAFPESERAAREAAWSVPSNYGATQPF